MPDRNENDPSLSTRVMLYVPAFVVQMVTHASASIYFAELVPYVRIQIALALCWGILVLLRLAAMVHEMNPFMTKKQHNFLLQLGNFLLLFWTFWHLPALASTFGTGNIKGPYALAIISILITHGIMWKYAPTKFVDSRSESTTHTD